MLKYNYYTSILYNILINYVEPYSQYSVEIQELLSVNVTGFRETFGFVAIPGGSEYIGEYCSSHSLNVNYELCRTLKQCFDILKMNKNKKHALDYNLFCYVLYFEFSPRKLSKQMLIRKKGAIQVK